MDARKKKREPNCAVCLNHGLRILIKGHKRSCPHRYCACDKCYKTRKAQKFMADLQFIKRCEAAESNQFGRTADLNAIYRDRFLERKILERSEMKIVDKWSDNPILQDIEKMYNYIKYDLHVTDEDDMLNHCLVVLCTEINLIDERKQIEECILSIYRQMDD